jgi:hypothetical protein
MRGFTLVEILVVLALIALGWMWVPSLFQSTVTRTQGQFYHTFHQLHARARMEALVRGRSVALGWRADNQRLAVLEVPLPGSDAKIIAQAPIPPEVIFNSSASRSGPTDGVFSILSDGTHFYRVWSYNPDGTALQNTGRLIFTINSQPFSYTLAQQGGLVSGTW